MKIKQLYTKFSIAKPGQPSYTGTFFCDRGAESTGQLESYEITMSADRFTIKRRGNAQVIVVPDHNVACYEILKEPEKSPPSKL